MHISVWPEPCIEEFSKFEKKEPLICEGKARMIIPEETKVFYNPVQEFNRDITIVSIKSFLKRWKKYNNESEMFKHKKPKISKQNMIKVFNDEFENRLNLSDRPSDQIIILEALAATGIRTMRYCLEIDGIYRSIANDLDVNAVQTIALNAKYHGIFEKCIPVQMDAIQLMSLFIQPKNYRPSVIDIDPYGSASKFLDSAVQAIAEGGMLCITCTDMGTLCGNSPETSFARYGSLPLKTPFCHEMAIRILLSSIESSANRYQRHIFPLLSLSVDFYIRVFVQVFTSALQVKKSILKKSYVLLCSFCGSYSLIPIAEEYKPNSNRPYSKHITSDSCSICSGKQVIGGPVWSDSLYDISFINDCIDVLNSEGKCFGTNRRISGILQVIKEELIDIPFYYNINSLFSVVRSTVPPSLSLRSAIARLGYKASSTHCHKTGLKTDIPIESIIIFYQVLWDVVRAWVEKMEKPLNGPSSTEGKKILSLKSKLDVNFSKINSLKPESVKSKMTRFQINPLSNWGPQKRGRIANLIDEN